jgi:hypothetical protein
MRNIVPGKTWVTVPVNVIGSSLAFISAMQKCAKFAEATG